MEAFYISIIFLGIILVIGSLFFIIMDRVNGKDFFKEFDRKKDEMFNLIQDSEEMVQELNKMSDYVITVISEKNQEFFKKTANSENNVENLNTEIIHAENDMTEKQIEKSEEESVNIIDKNFDEQEKLPAVAEGINQDSKDRMVNMQFSHDNAVTGHNTDPAKPGLVLNSKRREVLKMIEQGLSNDEICDKLKIGKGEIGLIRGLCKNNS